MKPKHLQAVQIIVFLTCLLAASWVQAATFSISFFGYNNTKVGQGQFATDPDKTFCVEAHNLGSCTNPSLPIAPGGPNQYEIGWVVDRQNPLTGFSATIQGVSWGFEAAPTWWKAGDQPPGQQSVSRYGIGVGNGYWFFGDPFEGIRQFYMSFNQATDSFGSGTWGQQTGYDQNGKPLPAWVYGNGTWVATETPIPAAIWSFGSALGVVGLGLFRRKARGA